MFTRPGRNWIGPEFDYSEGRWERGSTYKYKIGRQTTMRPGEQAYTVGILAERVTLAQDSPHGETNQAAGGQSTDEAEARDGGSNVDVFPPAF